jgi:thiol-disulfide isomerase/thioredoxin
MIRRWRSGLILVGLALLPIVVQWGISSIEAYRFGNAHLQLRDEPRPVGTFEFVDRDGHTLALSSMRGRYILLNVWASWCPPCRKELPSLDRLKAILEPETDISVLALSVDRAGFEQLQAFYNTYGIRNLELYRGDQDAVFEALAVYALPTTLLIDDSGQEVARLSGPTVWDAPDVVENIKAIRNHR